MAGNQDISRLRNSAWGRVGAGGRPGNARVSTTWKPASMLQTRSRPTEEATSKLFCSGFEKISFAKF